MPYIATILIEGILLAGSIYTIAFYFWHKLKFKGELVMYKRKTYDEYQIQGNYGQGFKEVTAEDSYKAAKI